MTHTSPPSRHQDPSTHGAEEPSQAAGAFSRLLQELGATHVVTLPDNTSAPLLEALEQARRGAEADGGADGAGEASGPHSGPPPRPPVRTLIGTREGEVIALASGLWLGGSSPVVLIQNTGLLEAGDSLRGTAARMGAPILLLVTCRGFAKARAAGLEPDGVEVDREVLVRNDLDSVAHMTHSTLRAWGIPYLVLDAASDLSPIRQGWERAHAEERPVAVLIDTSFTGGA